MLFSDAFKTILLFALFVQVIIFHHLEHGLMGHIGHEHGPALDVEDGDELDCVQEREPRGHEEAHPDHA